jgi:conjugative relaxase-like TrwC/TraI family protein
VLSTAKVRTSSWRYYANQVGHGACEYFLGVGEAPGRWYGRGLEGLGLEPRGVVRDWQLEATFGRALHPVGRVQLGRAWRADGVTGYDLCFSAPKSVSALWALGGPDVGAAIRAAHAAAVRAGLEYLDSHAAFSRVGRNGHTQVDTAGFAAAVFDHRTSRAGDPQLHTHALVLNKLQCPDGEWRTIDGHEIYAHKKSAGVVYQAALRSELTRRLGVGWTEVSKDGQAEIVGVPQTLITRWSTRAEQVAAESAPVIAAYETELGRTLTSAERTAVAKVAVLKTRPGKEQVDIVGLVDRWHAEAAALGWTPDRVVHAVRVVAGPRSRRYRTSSS